MRPFFRGFLFIYPINNNIVQGPMMQKTKKQKMQRKTIQLAAVLCAVGLLCWQASAVRVAVVITQPSGLTYVKCISVNKLTNAYDVLESTGKDLTWSPPGPWGHGLCAIEGTGCPAKNCFCDPENSWRFYVKQWSSDTWKLSMKSFDGGSSCDEHYCAQDGDVIGLAYGGDNAQPASFRYSDICLPISRSGDGIEDIKKTTTKPATSSSAPTTTQQKQATTQQTTTTQEAASKAEETTSSINPTTTTKPRPTTTTKPTTTTEKATTTSVPATTAPTSTKPPTTTPVKEEPGIVGDVISYSVKNPPIVAILAAMLAAAYISYGAYMKRVRAKNA